MNNIQPAASDPGRTVKSADRTLEILELLSDHGGRLTLTELQQGLGVPKSSLHGLLRTLTARGWLETDARGTSYGIGLRALRVGAAYLEGDPMVRAAGPVLDGLRKELDETVHLARLNGSDVVYLASRESLHHLRSASRISRRLPAHATALGKALLAELEPEEVDSLLPPDPLPQLTPQTVTDHSALQAELTEIRLRGWSMERGQNTPGLGCVAVTVPSQRPALDAISCSMPLARLTDEHLRTVIETLARRADELAHLVGPGMT